jgi:maltose phosphorylase
MENIIQIDSWQLVEEHFQAENQPLNENKFFLGNGEIGQTGNFEEHFSGKTEPKTTLTGIFVLNSTENTDSNQFKLSNLPNWTKLNIRLNTQLLDLANCEVLSYSQTLNMKQGFLERNFEVISSESQHISVSIQRFLSIAQPELGAIKYSLKSIDFVGKISFSPVIDGDINNNEPEWNVLQSKTQKDVAHLWIQTRKTNLQVCEAVTYELFKNNAQIKTNPTKIEKHNVAGFSVGVDLKAGDTVCIYKFVSLLNSLDHPSNEITTKACNLALNAKNKGWNELFEENCSAWEQKWVNYENEKSTDEIYKYFNEYHPKL